MSATESNLDDKFAKAEAALKALGDQYLVSIEEDLAKITDCLAKAGEAADGRKPHFDTIFAVAHDMKGQGATFGYPLLTEIGESLCRFIEASDPDAPATLAVVGTHIETVRVILRGKMAGESAEGQAMIDAINQAVANATS